MCMEAVKKAGNSEKGGEIRRERRAERKGDVDRDKRGEARQDGTDSMAMHGRHGSKGMELCSTQSRWFVNQVLEVIPNGQPTTKT